LVLPLVIVLPGSSTLAAQAETWEPTRINKVVELWEAGQAAYYTQTSTYGYDECQELSGTTADYISINMEHSYVDVRLLRECMQGLVDAGPTRSGHRTPAVIAVLPAWGWDAAQMQANYWIVQQIQMAGVHGVLLTHAVDPAAVRLMVENLRYPFAPVVPGLARGRQGSGSAGFAADIWGVSDQEYFRKSDLWALEKEDGEGEFIVGLKLEDPYGQLSANELVRVPGVAFVEHGPGDTSYWYGGPEGDYVGRDEELAAVDERVFEAATNAGVFYLHDCNDLEWLDRGVRVCTNANSAEDGRLHMGRQMPW
jgi:4-hydroxy-2-oxoheptanedioate aldolase